MAALPLPPLPVLGAQGLGYQQLLAGWGAALVLVLGLAFMVAAVAAVAAVVAVVAVVAVAVAVVAGLVLGAVSLVDGEQRIPSEQAAAGAALEVVVVASPSLGLLTRRTRACCQGHPSCRTSSRRCST